MSPRRGLLLVLPFLCQLCIAVSVEARWPPHPQNLSCVVLLYSDLSNSETSFTFQVLLRQTGKCGCHVVWKNRPAFLSLQKEVEINVVAILLAASFGPSDAEQEVLKNLPESQLVTILHFSDEMLLSIDTSIYGRAKRCFRNYYHHEMNHSSLLYLSGDTVLSSSAPEVLWMPLGVANLKGLPTSFTYRFLDRPLLWSWAGSTDNKPERREMLEALEKHNDAEHIVKRGFLHSFGVYAGLEQLALSPESLNTWEYSMIMQQTQFVPAPAGISPEQFRIWEAIEAGTKLLTPCTLLLKIFVK